MAGISATLEWKPGDVGAEEMQRLSGRDARLAQSGIDWNRLPDQGLERGAEEMQRPDSHLLQASDFTQKSSKTPADLPRVPVEMRRNPVRSGMPEGSRGRRVNRGKSPALRLSSG